MLPNNKDWNFYTKVGDFFSGCASLPIFCSSTFLSSRRHLLPSAAPLRTVRATFTAYGSSLH
ncbi:hypothetical protein FKA31_13335 [Vibrio anguillarum]|nr:hypothetical protein [Vibrio anguillarum]NNN96989.1 hypothetical protein [Vibrio sp. B4-6]